MKARLRQFVRDIAAAFRALFAPTATRAARTGPPPEPRTLILAYSHDDAYQYARLNGITNWYAPTQWEHLVGYRGVRIIRLAGWQNRKDPAFMRELARLEATNHL